MTPGGKEQRQVLEVVLAPKKCQGRSSAGVHGEQRVAHHRPQGGVGEEDEDQVHQDLQLTASNLALS